MAEAIEKKKVFRYGRFKIDSKLLDTLKPKEKPMTQQETLKNYVQINAIKSFVQKAQEPEELPNLRSKFKNFSAELQNLIKTKVPKAYSIVFPPEYLEKEAEKQQEKGKKKK